MLLRAWNKAYTMIASNAVASSPRELVEGEVKVSDIRVIDIKMHDSRSEEKGVAVGDFDSD